MAVEFQMYLISPFLVKQLATSKKPWLLPLILIAISTGLNFLINYFGCCPDTIFAGPMDANKDCNDCLWLVVY